MIIGQQSWLFANEPVIISTGVVGGPFEGDGPLAADFDRLHEDVWMGQDSFEKAQKLLMEEASELALKKAGLQKEDVQFMFGGDLINQITATSFAARTLAIPFFGLFGACATMTEGLALAALTIQAGAARYVLTGTSSHHAAVEKQFRYPNEYGSQKPPTAQWTATASGAAIIAPEGKGAVVTAATIGRVVDMGISDPFNMGAAMAPAAVDTIEAHFRDTGRDPSYYDYIVTGDLGKIGRPIALELLNDHQWSIGEDKFLDCGLLIYRDDQPVQAGASGAGCSAAVTYGHLLRRMEAGEFSRLLVVATGALLSPLTYQQKETIPCIAHAVAIEAKRRENE